MPSSGIQSLNQFVALPGFEFDVLEEFGEHDPLFDLGGLKTHIDPCFSYSSINISWAPKLTWIVFNEDARLAQAVNTNLLPGGAIYRTKDAITGHIVFSLIDLGRDVLLPVGSALEAGPDVQALLISICLELGIHPL